MDDPQQGAARDRELAELRLRFVAATADGSSHDRLATLSALLRKVREQLRMDVVFVSQFIGGRRVFRFVDRAPGEPDAVKPGGSDPLEESYCQRVADGRLPSVVRDARQHPESAQLPATHAMGVGAHLSVPVVLRDGSVYGTLCCFSHEAMNWLAERDADTMRSIANLIARRIDAGAG